MTKKEKLLRELNEAYANNDSDYIIENVTDDIQWDIIGDRLIKGKENFMKAITEMAGDTPYQLTISHIITHGDSAAVDGTMKTPDGNTYAFCDIYKFSGFKNAKIKKMTSYAIHVK